MQYAGFRDMIFSSEEHMLPSRWGKLGSSRDRDHKRIRFKYVLAAKLKSVSILSVVSSMYRYRINNCTAFSFSRSRNVSIQNEAKKNYSDSKWLLSLGITLRLRSLKANWRKKGNEHQISHWWKWKRYWVKKCHLAPNRPWFISFQFVVALLFARRAPLWFLILSW